jgi:hypothetical protein
MQFSFRYAPKWFHDHILNYYTDELHAIQKAAETIPDYDDQRFKQIAVDFFTGKGFTVWLDKSNHLYESSLVSESTNSGGETLRSRSPRAPQWCHPRALMHH